ncbi:MAG: VOC family protein [bacterium]
MLKRINFQVLYVTDQQRALEFYRDRLGMTVQTDGPDGQGGRWIAMEIPGAETRLHLPKADTVPRGTAPRLYLVTDDVDAEAARLTAAGVPLDVPPTTASWDPAVRFAMLTDSEGNPILLQSSRMEP